MAHSETPTLNPSSTHATLREQANTHGTPPAPVRPTTPTPNRAPATPHSTVAFTSARCTSVNAYEAHSRTHCLRPGCIIHSEHEAPTTSASPAPNTAPTAMPNHHAHLPGPPKPTTGHRPSNFHHHPCCASSPHPTTQQTGSENLTDTHIQPNQSSEIGRGDAACRTAAGRLRRRWSRWGAARRRGRRGWRPVRRAAAPSRARTE